MLKKVSNALLFSALVYVMVPSPVLATGGINSSSAAPITLNDALKVNDALTMLNSGAIMHHVDNNGSVIDTIKITLYHGAYIGGRCSGESDGYYIIAGAEKSSVQNSTVSLNKTSLYTIASQFIYGLDSPPLHCITLAIMGGGITYKNSAGADPAFDEDCSHGNTCITQQEANLYGNK